MAAKIFIDGEHGTTGLQIRSRLAARYDLEILSLPEAERRNVAMREDMLNGADIAILCLPDDAAVEAVNIVAGNGKTRVIDTSTAHRVHPDWAYGFAEMDAGQSKKIASARFVANPQPCLAALCDASGAGGADCRHRCLCCAALWRSELS